ncbi:hypothetical protein GOODEAATRI_028304 [Goodea atripinnis]|uniref:Uncharacterized protein n=1 Tax=Goodea atripinnis TaxID=208336 RepID=A0ABV0MLE7_9TELE
MRRSNLDSDCRRFSAKVRTDSRLARSSCMKSTWWFPARITLAPLLARSMAVSFPIPLLAPGSGGTSGYRRQVQ